MTATLIVVMILPTVAVVMGVVVLVSSDEDDWEIH